jgi:hypothetical protein
MHVRDDADVSRLIAAVMRADYAGPSLSQARPSGWIALRSISAALTSITSETLEEWRSHAAVERPIKTSLMSPTRDMRRFPARAGRIVVKQIHHSLAHHRGHGDRR